MAKKKNITDWYREKIEDNMSSPPVEVWENIENELDIDLVWERVSKRLDFINLFSKIKKITYYSAAAISLFLFIDYFVLNRSAKDDLDQESLSIENAYNEPDNASQFIVEDTNRTSDTIIADQQKVEKNLSESGIKDLKNTPLEDKSTGNAIPPVIADHLSGQPEWVETKPEESLTRIDAVERITPVEPIYKELIAESSDGYFELQPSFQLDPVSTPQESNVFLQGLYFGLSTHLRNMWLLNNTTFNGLKSNDLTTTVPDFGKSIRLLAGKNLSEKFALQIEGAIIDEGGQKYFQYIHGKYISRVIDLDYITFNIHLKYRRSPLWVVNIPVSSNVIFGSYAGYLKSASEMKDTEIENIKYAYNKMDFGLMIGYEYDFYIKRKIIISSGVRFKVGLPNVFAGNELIPSTFNKTNTASANLIIGIKYFIQK